MRLVLATALAFAISQPAAAQNKPKRAKAAAQAGGHTGNGFHGANVVGSGASRVAVAARRPLSRWTRRSGDG